MVKAINIETPLYCKAKVHTVGPRCPLGPGLPCNPCVKVQKQYRITYSIVILALNFFALVYFLCITSRFLSLGLVLG